MKAALSVILLVAIFIALFMRRTRRDPAAANPGPAAKAERITSRYAEAPGVVIDPMKVPLDLQDLLPLAEKWAIGDDVQRAQFRESVPLAERKELIDAVWYKWDRLEQYCSEKREQVPVPDEVVLLDMMAEAATEILPEFGYK